jgi:hypothetical protein
LLFIRFFRGIISLAKAQTVGMKIFKCVAAVCAAMLCLFPLASCTENGSSAEHSAVQRNGFENIPDDFAEPNFEPDFPPMFDAEETGNENAPHIKPIPPFRHHGDGRDKMPTPPHHGSDEEYKREENSNERERTIDEPADSSSDESSKNHPLRPEPRFKFRRPPQSNKGR